MMYTQYLSALFKYFRMLIMIINKHNMNINKINLMLRCIINYYE